MMWDVLGGLGILAVTLLSGGWLLFKLMERLPVAEVELLPDDDDDDCDTEEYDWDRETWWLVDDSEPKWSGQ